MSVIKKDYWARVRGGFFGSTKLRQLLGSIGPFSPSWPASAPAPDQTVRLVRSVKEKLPCA